MNVKRGSDGQPLFNKSRSGPLLVLAELYVQEV